VSGLDKALPVIVSVVIIVLVAVVQERSRHVAAIVAMLPLTAPLAAWIVYSASGGNHQHTAQFVRSMLAASIANVVFIVVFWYGLRQQWPLAAVVIVAFGVWGVLVTVPDLVRRVL
jgi:uncharacterized membrane protein (GlpM family)